MTTQPIILLVEDDEDDRFLSERALSKAGLRRVHHVSDGSMAIDYLLGQGTFASQAEHPLPDIVLLDLKIPEINGHQVLEWINTQPGLVGCLVFILSSSGEARDRTRAEIAHAAGYFIKPLTGQNINQMLSCLEERIPKLNHPNT